MRQNNETIHIILTGGTIDSHWEGSLDTAVPNRHSIMQTFIQNLQLYQKFKFTEIVMKDSRDLTIADRKAVARAMEKSESKKIIVTHGTYTMAVTAKFLKKHLKRKDQTIVFTGSMSPLQGFTISDAPFSVGYALAKVEELPPGIYICMNGKTFTAKEAEKDTAKGRFYSIFEDKQ
jgi:L-asparaginase